MMKKIDKNDLYTILLMMWYFGMDRQEVINSEWTQEEIDKAQECCKKRHFDPFDWAQEWELI